MQQTIMAEGDLPKESIFQIWKQNKSHVKHYTIINAVGTLLHKCSNSKPDTIN